MVGSRGVTLAPASVVQGAPLMICVEVQAPEHGKEALVRMAAAVDAAWIEEDIRRETVVVFDQSKGRVVSLVRKVYLDLVLEERIGASPDPLEAAEVLAQAALKDIDAVIPWDQEGLSALVQRVRFLASHMPELGLPMWKEGELAQVLVMACAGLRSMAALKALPWAKVLLESLTWTQRKALEEHAPERMDVPSGSKIRLQYQEDGPPVLAVRIQGGVWPFGDAEGRRGSRGCVDALAGAQWEATASDRRPGLVLVCGVQ